MSNKKYKVVSLFSGCGGMDLGFEGGFENPVNQTLTNASGYSETYRVYRSTNAGLGETTIEVREV